MIHQEKVGVIGAGYVGLVVAACLAKLGFKTLVIENNTPKLSELQKGKVPFFEPGLEALVDQGQKQGYLHFSADYEALQNMDLLFLAVGTPSLNGRADLSGIWNCLESLLKIAKRDLVVVVKSTVPPGTCSEIKSWWAQNGRADISVVSNPEFLREGTAVSDFLEPDRVVLGGSGVAVEKVQSVYRTWVDPAKIFILRERSSEFSKYAANAFLASRISFVNEMALLCEKWGAHIDEVVQVLGSDPRIGPHFLKAGCGYGGSCFPKDLEVLYEEAKRLGLNLKMVSATVKVNESQKKVPVQKLMQFYGGDLKGKKIAVLGLAFKPMTNDLRQSPSLTTVVELLEQGCKVAVFDPVAIPAFRSLFADRVVYAESSEEAVLDADGVVLLTEWPEFYSLNWEVVKQRMATPLVVDGRNFLHALQLNQRGFTYMGVGV